MTKTNAIGRLDRKAHGRADRKGLKKKPKSPHDPSCQRDAHRFEGRSLRSSCPRSSHSGVTSDQPQRDPLSLIEKSNDGRVEHLVPVRTTRMLESPFGFFRGSAIVQAHDLKGTPSAGIIVQSCGDCHLMNFGAFASPERTLIFDINDFDETLPAPFEWDVKRLATSLVLAARWREFDADEARAAGQAAVKSYREQMAAFAAMKVLDVWYARIAVAELLPMIKPDAEVRKRVTQLMDTASKRTSEAVFHKITREVEGRPRILDQPPLLYHADRTLVNVEEHVIPFFEAYRNTLPADVRLLFDRFEFMDAAFKVVGVGSVGTNCYVTLWMADVDDPLFLQVKQARPSVLEGPAGPSRYENDGERVVVGQRLMQSASDIFLGWTRGPRGNDFYVRQLRDQKAAVDPVKMNPRILRLYGELCGRCLARAHAKPGGAPAISGYLGSRANFDEAVADYAVAYADQAERDYDLFKAAVRSGRFRTDTLPTGLEAAMR